MQYFNPRPREGSDRHAQPAHRRCLQFQSTLPRRERHPDKIQSNDNRKFQSTLPRRERPRSSNRNIYSNIISIHAPAKGATGRWAGRLVQVQFQSTLPRRERLQHALTIPVTGVISIHAPAKGATPCTERGISCIPHFNPRSREGSDMADSPMRRIAMNFNPRSREGSDKTIEAHSREKRISIHAPVKGATRKARLLLLHHFISIHAPVKGATKMPLKVGSMVDISIHAPVKGATRRYGNSRVRLKIFQSTLP